MNNLDYEIREIERAIKIKEKRGGNPQVEYALLEAYRDYQKKNPQGELSRDLLYNHTRKPT